MYRLWREPSLGWHKFILSPHRNPKSQNLCSDLSLFAEDKVLRVGWCHSCCNVASHNHPFFAPRWVVRLPQLLRRLKMFQTCPESKQVPETLGMMAPHSCCLPRPSFSAPSWAVRLRCLKMFLTCLKSNYLRLWHLGMVALHTQLLPPTTILNLLSDLQSG